MYLYIKKVILNAFARRNTRPSFFLSFFPVKTNETSNLSRRVDTRWDVGSFCPKRRYFFERYLFPCGRGTTRFSALREWARISLAIVAVGIDTRPIRSCRAWRCDGNGSLRQVMAGRCNKKAELGIATILHRSRSSSLFNHNEIGSTPFSQFRNINGRILAFSRNFTDESSIYWSFKRSDWKRQEILSV